MAGGVALHGVGNGRRLREGPFERIWIQPAAGDAGGALGCAQLAWHRHFKEKRVVVPGRDAMKGAYLGPSYGEAEIEAFLISEGAPFVKMERDELNEHVASLLADEKIVGWF